jgi:hypothetical protein
MSFKSVINPKTKTSFQEGGPRDVLKGLGESFHRSRTAKSSAEAVPAAIYQPCVFYTQLKKRFLQKPLAISMPFYSDSVFLKEEDAVAFLPYFLKKLVEKGLVPKEVISSEGKVDTNVIEPGMATLTLAFAEKSDVK